MISFRELQVMSKTMDVLKNFMEVGVGGGGATFGSTSFQGSQIYGLVRRLASGIWHDCSRICSDMACNCTIMCHTMPYISPSSLTIDACCNRAGTNLLTVCHCGCVGHCRVLRASFPDSIHYQFQSFPDLILFDSMQVFRLYMIW